MHVYIVSDMRTQIRPYQEAMGRGVLDVGDVPEAGNVMKVRQSLWSSFGDVQLYPTCDGHLSRCDRVLLSAGQRTVL